MLRFTCPKCGKSLKVADHAAGRQCTCTRCGEAMRVPGPGKTTEEAPAPRPPAADDQRTNPCHSEQRPDGIHFRCANCSALCSHPISGVTVVCQTCGQKLVVPTPPVMPPPPQNKTLLGVWEPGIGSSSAQAAMPPPGAPAGLPPVSAQPGLPPPPKIDELSSNIPPRHLPPRERAATPRKLNRLVWLIIIPILLVSGLVAVFLLMLFFDGFPVDNAVCGRCFSRFHCPELDRNLTFYQKCAIYSRCPVCGYRCSVYEFEMLTGHAPNPNTGVILDQNMQVPETPLNGPHPGRRR
jgi:hypothetical protein